MSARTLLGAYRLCYCVLILIASIQTLAAEGAADSHVVPLATAEIAGALLLLVPRTQWLGLTLLLGVFACAQVLAALSSAWPTRFLQYAASALLIVLLERALRAGRTLRPETREAGATAS
jgi:hypothetical protein